MHSWVYRHRTELARRYGGASAPGSVGRIAEGGRGTAPAGEVRDALLVPAPHRRGRR